MRRFVLAIAMFAMSCYRLRYNNVRISHSKCTRLESVTLKMKVKFVEDLDEIGRRTWFVNVHTLAEIGAFRSSRLFPVTFRGVRTYSTYIQCIVAHHR